MRLPPRLSNDLTVKNFTSTHDNAIIFLNNFRWRSSISINFKPKCTFQQLCFPFLHYVFNLFAIKNLHTFSIFQSCLNKTLKCQASYRPSLSRFRQRHFPSFKPTFQLHISKIKHYSSFFVAGLCSFITTIIGQVIVNRQS